MSRDPLHKRPIIKIEILVVNRPTFAELTAFYVFLVKKFSWFFFKKARLETNGILALRFDMEFPGMKPK